MAFNKSELNYSLTKPPKAIKAQIQLCVDKIEAEFAEQTAMIWLFGSYARGDFINDRRISEDGAITEYQSDVDILVVLDAPMHPNRVNQNERLIKKLAKRVDNVALDLNEHPDIDRNIHLIYETLDRFNDALNHSEYFYLDVVNEGVVLVDNQAPMAEPQQMPAVKRREYGIRYFEDLFGQVLEFQQSFEFHYQRGHNALAMFSLHQLTEHLFKVYLLVKTHYKPRTHKIWDLRKRVKKLDEHIVSIFPRETEDQQKQFAFLCEAYIDSRYKTQYTVDQSVLDALAERVQVFEHWVYKECLETIDGFIPQKRYSPTYDLPHPLLSVESVKTQLLPENLIKKMENELLRAQKEKQQALAELEIAKQKLRDAGLE